MSDEMKQLESEAEEIGIAVSDLVDQILIADNSELEITEWNAVQIAFASMIEIAFIAAVANS